MTVAHPAPVASSPGLPVVIVIGDALRLRHQASRLLADAGFYLQSGMCPGTEEDLVLYLSSGDAASRIDAVRSLLQEHPGIRLIASMPHQTPRAQLRRVLRAGVAGLLVDDALDEALVATAHAVHAGQLAVPLSLRKHVAPRALSFREKQVLGLVVLGLTNREIADKLFLAESTVKTHLSSAFAKLDARNRAEAAAVIVDPHEGHGLGILSITGAEQPPAPPPASSGAL
jgi:DNA-binding NarL/FixJ family response regulator